MPAAAITPIPVTTPHVRAFRISGEVRAADLEAMARTMNDAFDRHDSVSMLLLFQGFTGVAPGAGLDRETITAQFRALARVARYAVVGAPDAAARMIEVMDHVIPVDARSFDAADEPAAWAFVGAEPPGAARA